jgi:hypothetical protein
VIFKDLVNFLNVTGEGSMPAGMLPDITDVFRFLFDLNIMAGGPEMSKKVSPMSWI